MPGGHRGWRRVLILPAGPRDGPGGPPLHPRQLLLLHRDRLPRGQGRPRLHRPTRQPTHGPREDFLFIRICYSALFAWRAGVLGTGGPPGGAVPPGRRPVRVQRGRAARRHPRRQHQQVRRPSAAHNSPHLGFFQGILDLSKCCFFSPPLTITMSITMTITLTITMTSRGV